MALILSNVPDDQNEIDAEGVYARIVSVFMDFKAERGAIALDCYRSKLARDKDKNPFCQMRTVLIPEPDPTYNKDGSIKDPGPLVFSDVIKAHQDVINQVKALCYELVKSEESVKRHHPVDSNPEPEGVAPV